MKRERSRTSTCFGRTKLLPTSTLAGGRVDGFCFLRARRSEACSEFLRTDDANGNTLTDPSGKSYSWDFENRLTQAVVSGSNGGTTSFRYDPFGRRIQKSGPLGTTNYLYDGPNAVEEADSSGNVLARYTQGREIDESLAMLRSGTMSYYEADGVASITSLSNSAGALANTYTFDSFGQLTAHTGTLANPFQYTGREFDSETGINYYRERYFDPSSGRFLSEDPLRFTTATNFYPYAANNPLRFNDPMGLSAADVQRIFGSVRSAQINLRRAENVEPEAGH